jgi:protein SCO1/2
MLLVLAPAATLAFLVAVWGRPLARALSELPRRRAGRVVIVALVAVFGGGAWTVGGKLVLAAKSGLPLDSTLEPLPADYPRSADPAPPLRLVDQTGAAFDLESLRGRPAIVTFAYGHCATVCPILVHAIRDARVGYPGTPPPAVVVTLDPWRDTPGSLPGLAHAWSLDAANGDRLLTGSPEVVVAAAEAWQVGFARDESTGEITHPGLVLILDAEGRIAYRFLGPPAHWLIEAARRLEPQPV